MLQLGKKVVNSLIAVGMRPAHKAVTDETDVERFHGGFLIP